MADFPDAKKWLIVERWYRHENVIHPYAEGTVVLFTELVTNDDSGMSSIHMFLAVPKL